MLDAADSPVALHLLHAFVRVKRMTWRQSPVAGLTTSEIMVLSCIKRGVAAEGCGLRVSEIGNRLDLAAPTITQQLNDLETRGLVARHVDPEDRRAIRVELTERGDVATRMAWDAFLASFTGLVGHLGEDDSRTLARLLAEALRYFEEARGEHP